MSNTTKRDAETAFEGDSNQTSGKNKRARRKAGQNPQHESSQNTPTKQKKLRGVHDLPSATKAHGTKNSKSAKLEDRITLPSSAPEPSTRTEAKNTQLVKNRHKKSKVEKPSGSHRANKKQKSGLDSWKVSATSGGIFINHDPILTSDGQYLVLPTSDKIHVYSTSTSLLVRSIVAKERDSINCCSVSARDNKVLLVATRRGTIVKLNVDTGNKIGQWKTTAGIKSIASVSDDGLVERVLVLKSLKGEHDELLLCLLQSGGRMDSRALYRHDNLYQLAAASSDASVVVVCGGSKVHLGKQDSEDDQKYSWHTFTVQGSIVDFDVRIAEQAARKKQSVSVDIAVGLDNGMILIYENVLSALVNGAKGGQKVELNSRKLHWHRNPVRSVKWSKDGNYIISGGDETVLVIWQLETNQQQYLPHLSTSILNITVSATGAHYALRLSDNSVMVLSTADLLPSTNVSGLSLPAGQTDRVPILLHPIHSNRLLAAVPIRQAQKNSNCAATHLQTYDIDTSLQLNRQALTRNVTTAVNISPTGRPLEEPSVTHLQISSDGNWLATIDTWSPDTSDTQALHLEDDQVAKQKHTETTLRFWSWNTEDSSWDLVTRIDEPHAAGKHAVLELISNPASSEFCTMGGDGFAKVWKPKKRTRDGVQVRNKSGQALFNWSCICSVQAEKSELDSMTRQPFGAMAYSSDGSVLMASWSRTPRHVHIIDPRSGTISMSMPSLLAEGQASMIPLGRYLLCLSTSFRIFDMITLQTTFSMSIERHHGSFLAVNERTNSFAIGLNPQDRLLPAIISVFSMDNLDQGSINDFEVSGQIRALLAEPSARGFVIVDNECRIRKLTPAGKVLSTSMALVRSADILKSDLSKGFEDIFGDGKIARVQDRVPQKMLEDGEGPRSLTDLLHAPSTSSQLGISELFDRVAKAISGSTAEVSG